jgi:L-glutamine-phosphate cytidylyltransferase
VLARAPPTEDASLLVDPDRIDEEAMKVRLDKGRFVESSKAIPLGDAAGEWTGIARFAPRAARAFHAHAGALLSAGEHQAYDTAAFNRMAADGIDFKVHKTGGLPWIEIDTPRDLKEAHSLFPGHRLEA